MIQSGGKVILCISHSLQSKKEAIKRQSVDLNNNGRTKEIIKKGNVSKIKQVFVDPLGLRVTCQREAVQFVGGEGMHS